MAGKYTGKARPDDLGQIWTLTVSCAAVALVVSTMTLACLLLAPGALGDRYERRELLVSAVD